MNRKRERFSNAFTALWFLIVTLLFWRLWKDLNVGETSLPPIIQQAETITLYPSPLMCMASDLSVCPGISGCQPFPHLTPSDTAYITPRAPPLQSFLTSKTWLHLTHQSNSAAVKS